MARKDKYTPMGKQIAKLGRNQSEIAEVLGLTQQSVSGKLNGKIAITINDLETLCKAYDLPMTYFVGGDASTPESAKLADRVLNGDKDLTQTMEVMDNLDPSARAMVAGIIYQVQVNCSLQRGASDLLDLSRMPQMPVPDKNK